jgi:hypothetical protein
VHFSRKKSILDNAKYICVHTASLFLMDALQRIIILVMNIEINKSLLICISIVLDHILLQKDSTESLFNDICVIGLHFASY